MRKDIFLFLLALCFCFPSISVMAQRTAKPKLPAFKTPEERALIQSGAYHTPITSNKTADFLPPAFTVPGEYEESQAILVAWPYPNTATDRYSVLWSKLIDAIQYEVPAWILVDYPEDSTEVIDVLAANNVTLYNYKFFINPGNAFWARDYGPIGYYYSNQDSLGFVDMHYYPGRPLDDVVPQFLSEQIGVPNYRTELHMEGGNFMSDGYGRIFYSTVIPKANANLWGQLHSQAWDEFDTRDTLSRIYHAEHLTELEDLDCDGGTGHIDIYLKLLDEQTLVATQYPEVITAQDRYTIEDNVQYLKTLNSTYNRPFKVHRFITPTSNNGEYTRTTCTQLDQDARGFINGVFVNKTYIFPSYSNATNGNVAGDSAAVALYRQMLPGYRIVPIDARLLTPMGGAIHCVTMQIPADNPLRFWHPTVEGYQVLDQPVFDIQAKITNRSGIEKAICYWRKKGQIEWQNFELQAQADLHIGAIPNQNFTVTDTIEYYLWAKSNNGKEGTKPMTAPQGYYTFYFTNVTGTTNYFEAPQDYMYAAYPNPVSEQLTIPVYLTHPQTVSLQITDITGRTVYQTVENFAAGTSNFEVNAQNLPSGIYIYSVAVNGKYLNTRRFNVVR